MVANSALVPSLHGLRGHTIRACTPATIYLLHCPCHSQLAFSEAEALRLAAACKHLFTLGMLQLGTLVRVASPSADLDQRSLASKRLVVATACHLMTVNKLVSNLLNCPQRPASTVSAFARDAATPAAVLPWLEHISASLATCMDQTRPGEAPAA